ncbi:MAG: type II secretion system protein [bacterium]|nr:type II secretion system protein [bacterium]
MKKKGFTLVELLVVIAILALLMSIVIITINPAEILKKTRDTKRVSDLGALRTSLNLYLTDKVSPLLAPTTDDCADNLYYSFTGTPPASATKQGEDAGSNRIDPMTATSNRLTNGNGWIPVNFESISSGSPLSALPVDPTNATSSTATSNLYYSYACNATSTYFEVNAPMESTYYRLNGDGDVVSKDGGNCTTLYEVGNAPGLNLMSTSAAGFYQIP